MCRLLLATHNVRMHTWMPLPHPHEWRQSARFTAGYTSSLSRKLSGGKTGRTNSSGGETMMIIRVASVTVTHRNPHDHHRLTPPLGVRETVEDRGPTQRGVSEVLPLKLVR